MGPDVSTKMSPEIKLYLFSRESLTARHFDALAQKRSEILVVGVNRITNHHKEEIASAHVTCF
jgi:hypothetical protein